MVTLNYPWYYKGCQLFLSWHLCCFLIVIGSSGGGKIAKKMGNIKGYWNQVKVFSAFFGWTLTSQYRFSNLERLFYCLVFSGLDFGSFVYSTDFFLKANISDGTRWLHAVAHYPHFLPFLLQQPLPISLFFKLMHLRYAGMLTW